MPATSAPLPVLEADSITMEHRFQIPRRTQSAPMAAVSSDPASAARQDAPVSGSGRKVSPEEGAQREQISSTPEPLDDASALVNQETMQLSFPTPADFRPEPDSELSVDQLPTVMHIAALPAAADESLGAKTSEYKHEAQAADTQGEHYPVTDHGAALRDTGQNASTAEKPQRKRPALRSSALVKHTFVPDQKTEPPGTVAATGLPFVDTPRPAVPMSDPSIEAFSIADEHTALLSSVSPPFATSAPPALQGDLPLERLSIAEQETTQLSAIQNIASSQQEAAEMSHQQQTARASMADQPTLAFTALTEMPAVLTKLTAHAPDFLRRALNVGLTRLQEPQPEGLLTRGFQAIHLDIRLDFVPALAVSNAFGLLLVSISYFISVQEYSYISIEACFLGGLLLMFVPNLVRLLSRAATRLERICLLCVLGLASYLIQFTSSPFQFSSFDDFLHWRTADDILRTGHLFSVNSMLPVSPYYPGLELVTNAISTTTGLSTIYASVIVINIAHLLMVLSLFLLYEQITSSSRMASIAVLIYMTNSHFIFFDTIYNYETLALPLALFMLYILVRFINAGKNYRWVAATAWPVLLAVVITHHMTSYFFDGLLLLWAGISFFRPVSRRTRVYLSSIALSGLILVLAYAFLLPGNPVWSYLSQYFGGAFTQLEQIISGTMKTRPLFTNNAQASPIWDRLLMTGSVVLVTFMLPFGLLSLQRRHRSNALAMTLGIVALAYPFTQAFRFTTFGTEITDRATAFLFLPIAYVLTIFITHFWPTRRLTRRALSFISGIIIVIFLGGIILAIGPGLSGLPGPYLVGADGRSVEPEGINAALWSLDYLGSGNRIATDRTNQMLFSTYGDQRILTRLNDNIDISPIFYSAQFDTEDIALLQYGQIHYLVVDTRLSTELPAVGIYFENDRPDSIISRDALTKFNNVAQIDRYFDSGDIVIYNTEGFINGSSP